MLLKIGQRPDHGFDHPIGLLGDCHRRIERFLQSLVVITDAAAGGRLTDAQRAELDAALTYFANAAPRHTADEEESLFPRLRQSQDPSAAQALEIVERLEHDHAAADRHHAAVDALGRQWLEQGRLAAAAVTGLRDHLAALQTIYQSHIAIEDREVFPVAERVLSADQLREIGREMAARRQKTGEPCG